MSSLFDGFGSMLAEIFGDEVVHTPTGGAAVTITGRFRRKPIEVLDEDGVAILVYEPTLRVPEPVASTINPDGLIKPENAPLYKVLSRHASGSPDAEGSVIFKLREVSEDV